MKKTLHPKLFYFLLYILDNFLQVWPSIYWRNCSVLQSLRGRFTGHRTRMKNPFADNKCKILRKYFGVGLCRNANYIVSIIEKLSGSGRDDNDIPIPGVTFKRQKMETKWMLTLQSVYPYGLNDRVDDKYMAEKESRVVANKLLPLHRLYKRPDYNYSEVKLDNSFLKQNFVKILTKYFHHNQYKRCWLFYSSFHQIL